MAPRKTENAKDTQRRKSPSLNRHTRRVIVKFHDRFGLPYEDAVGTHIEKRKVGPWRQFKKKFPGIKIQRLFTALKADELGRLVDECMKKVPTVPDLQTYFAVRCPTGVEPMDVAKTLASWPKVQVAYVESGVSQPPRVSPGPNGGGYQQQGYLQPASNGIDAIYASNQPGGNGDDDDNNVDLRFVDIEQGWELSHEDLPQDIELIHGVNRDFNSELANHGTAILGIVLAVPNGTVTGITPRVKTKMVASIWPNRTTPYPDRYNAILTAIHRLQFGDVLLIEDQLTAHGYYPSRLRRGMGWADYDNVPVEFEDALFGLIQNATQSRGIVVVEAAGNGTLDLDEFTLDSARVSQDSGAIMVAAGSSTEPHSYHAPSNFGSRMDCYAWGENIYTTGRYGNGPYVAGFGDTSGAAAIIAGAALSIQGFAEVNRSKRFSPSDLRNILKDSNTGTPSADRIGVMPDLKKIMTKYA